jgi:cytochrome c556
VRYDEVVKLDRRQQLREGMMRFLMIALIALLITATASAAEEDLRAPIELPPDMRSAFLEHMRHHMDSFDDVITQLTAADFKGAAQVAREQLVPGSGAGFGRYLPVEFREMGLSMHRAAADFAEVADAVPAQPTAADWQKTVTALQAISVQCRACHSAFRLQ